MRRLPYIATWALIGIFGAAFCGAIGLGLYYGYGVTAELGKYIDPIRENPEINFEEYVSVANFEAVKDKPPLGAEVLESAIHTDNVALLEALVRAGASPNWKSFFKSEYPLHFAVRENNIDAVRALLRCGADVDVQSDKDKATPLILAVQLNLYQIAEILINHGASTNLTDARGRTAVDYYKETGGTDLFQ